MATSATPTRHHFGRSKREPVPRRSGIIAGYAAGALARWFVTGTVVTIAALIAGMHVDGGGVDLVGMLGLGILVNLGAALWACGEIARRIGRGVIVTVLPDGGDRYLSTGLYQRAGL